ncbi:hypothetical protein HYU14_00865 [Candidatus Woesearchaeota archaeon]|nr:hypothetical protein [Candidatus Woesearchaeota archaeon]
MKKLNNFKSAKMSGIAIVFAVISLFVFAFFTAQLPEGMKPLVKVSMNGPESVTGAVVGVTGMAVETYTLPTKEGVGKSKDIAPGKYYIESKGSIGETKPAQVLFDYTGTLTPGTYTVVQRSSDGREFTAKDIKVEDGNKITVIRTGRGDWVEGGDGSSTYKSSTIMLDKKGKVTTDPVLMVSLLQIPESIGPKTNKEITENNPQILTSKEDFSSRNAVYFKDDGNKIDAPTNSGTSKGTYYGTSIFKFDGQDYYVTTKYEDGEDNNKAVRYISENPPSPATGWGTEIKGYDAKTGIGRLDSNVGSLKKGKVDVSWRGFDNGVPTKFSNINSNTMQSNNNGLYLSSKEGSLWSANQPSNPESGDISYGTSIYTKDGQEYYVTQKYKYVVSGKSESWEAVKDEVYLAKTPPNNKDEIEKGARGTIEGNNIKITAAGEGLKVGDDFDVRPQNSKYGATEKEEDALRREFKGTNEEFAAMLSSLESSTAIGATSTSSAASSSAGTKEVRRPIFFRGKWFVFDFSGKKPIEFPDDEEAKNYAAKINKAIERGLKPSEFTSDKEGKNDLFASSSGTLLSYDDSKKDFSNPPAGTEFWKKETLGANLEVNVRHANVGGAPSGEIYGAIGKFNIDIPALQSIKKNVKPGTTVTFDKNTKTFSFINPKEQSVQEIFSASYNVEPDTAHPNTPPKVTGTRTQTTTVDYYFDQYGSQITRAAHIKLAYEGNPGQEIKVPESNIFSRNEIFKGITVLNNLDIKQQRTEFVFTPESDGTQTISGFKTTSFAYDSNKGTLAGIVLSTGELNNQVQETVVYDMEKGTVTKTKERGIESVYLVPTPTEDINSLNGLEEEAARVGNREHNRKAFADWELKLTQYRGLSGFSQLFFDDETLAKWRENVDKYFAKYLGQDYFESYICSLAIDKESGPGTLSMETPNGLYDIIAHIEGTRSEPINRPDGTTEFVYKFTYNIRNPEGSPHKNLLFNIALYSAQGKRYLYPRSLAVKEGKHFIRGLVLNEANADKDFERGPVVKVSQNLYGKLCIEFGQTITNAEGDEESQVCNTITAFTGTGTEFEERTSEEAKQTPQGPKDFSEGEI